MNLFKTLTVDGQTYTVAAGVDDGAVSADTTWSSKKIDDQLGNIATALDGIIAIQNGLIGGDEA